MNITFIKKSTVIIMVKEWLEEAIENFGEDIVSVTASPAQKCMFAVDKHSEKSGKVNSDIIHSIIAKLKYVSNRVKFNVNLAIAFLCTRVSKSIV